MKKKPFEYIVLCFVEYFKARKQKFWKFIFSLIFNVNIVIFQALLQDNMFVDDISCYTVCSINWLLNYYFLPHIRSLYN